MPTEIQLEDTMGSATDYFQVRDSKQNCPANGVDAIAQNALATYAKRGGSRTIFGKIVDWQDPYISDSFDDISSQMDEISKSGYFGGPKPATERHNINCENPATQAIFRFAPALQCWIKHVPTALALDALYHPDSKTLHDGSPIDDMTREMFKNCLDGIGIRCRKAVVEHVITEEIQRTQGKDPVRSAHIVSVACGAAQPVLSAVQKSVSQGSRVPRILAIDYDPRALRLAQDYALQMGLQDNLQVLRSNILNPAGLALDQHFPIHEVQADVVEAVGIVEYLQPENKMYQYKGVVTERPKQAGAITLLRNCYSILRPGGVLLFGNMSTRHPQIDFTLNVIQWPHIVPRTPNEMFEICDAAEINGELTLYYPSNHVYPMYALRKPT